MVHIWELQEHNERRSASEKNNECFIFRYYNKFDWTEIASYRCLIFGFDETEVKKEPYTYTVKNAKGEDETYNITIVNNKYYWSPGGVAVIDENKRYVELCIQQWANERRISLQKIEQQLKDEEAAKK